MTHVAVGIRISGLDFEDPDVENVLGAKYANVYLAGEQPCVLKFLVDSSRVVSDATNLVRAMQADLPALVVHGVHRDLVGVSDIAHRAGVSREGARKWTLAAGFPEPFDVLRAASMPIWAWTDVVAWLRNERSLDLDESLPSLQTLTHLENCLMRNPDHTSVEWHQLTQPVTKVQQPTFQATVQRLPAGGRAQRIDDKFDLAGATAGWREPRSAARLTTC